MEHSKLAYTFCKLNVNLCEKLLFGVCGEDKKQSNAVS